MAACAGKGIIGGLSLAALGWAMTVSAQMPAPPSPDRSVLPIAAEPFRGTIGPTYKD